MNKVQRVVVVLVLVTVVTMMMMVSHRGSPLMFTTHPVQSLHPSPPDSSPGSLSTRLALPAVVVSQSGQEEEEEEEEEEEHASSSPQANNTHKPELKTTTPSTANSEPESPYLAYEDPIVHIPGTPKEVYTEPGPINATQQPTLKKILFWNDAYSNKHFGFGYGREPFIRAGCRVNTCFTTGDRTRFPPEQLDAVVWHWRSNDKSLPQKRYPHTRYVFWMMESASHMFGSLRHYNNLFNWTLTYRLDSDFPNPYGRLYRRRHPLPDPHRNYAEGKTKFAAWFVSNCHTIAGREKLTENLRKYIQVDQYGHCSRLKCERNEGPKCNAILDKNYKFYLSFENSLCQDYVTEKFFGALERDVIPVVYGLGNYSSQAPPHSYIDVLSFPTIKALADYLLYLHHNDTAYNEYFRWKQDYYVANYWARVSRAYCQMCERLHTDTTTKIYDMNKWFVSDSHCLTQSSNRIGSFIHGK